MTVFHHRKLPKNSTLLSGRIPPDNIGFTSNRLQIWYNNTNTEWHDDMPHAHSDSDECFIVLKGEITVEVEGEIHIIRAGEFCCFGIGVMHQVVSVKAPNESLIIRAPSISDKLFPVDDATT